MISKETLNELENEMDEPTGISTVSRPVLKMNAILLSKECGILIEMREGEGMKAPHFWRKVTTCELHFTLYFVDRCLFVYI
jgi:transmembrane E3 ubiquitin-protein ligase